MKQTRVLLLALFLTVVTTVFAQGEEPVALKYNFSEGTVNDFVMTVKGNVKVEISSNGKKIGNESAAEIESRFDYRHEVVESDDETGLSTIEITYGPAYMNTILNGQIIPNPDVPFIEGKTAVLVVNSKGEVESYTLPEEMPASLGAADFSRIFVKFPDKPLRIGEAWIADSESTTPGRNEQVLTHTVSRAEYTFVGREVKAGRQCARVRLNSKSDSSITSNDPALDLSGKVGSVVTGELLFDLDTGYPVCSETHTNINNRMETLAVTENGPEDGKSRIVTDMQTYLYTVIDLSDGLQEEIK